MGKKENVLEVGPDWAKRFSGQLLQDELEEQRAEAQADREAIEGAREHGEKPDDSMTTKEVCKKLRCADRTLRRYIRDRKLAATSPTGPGGRLLFKREDVERFWRKRTRREK